MIFSRYSKLLTTVYVLLLILLSGCPGDESQSGQADTSGPTCYHENSRLSEIPIGINVDPLRSQQLNVDWDTIFADIDYLRNGYPLNLRITLRAQWMQNDAQYDNQGNVTVFYDKSPGSYYDQVRIIYNKAQASNGAIKILGILYGTPWFNSADGSQGPGIPLDPAIWEDFVTTMISDFPDIDDWEIWNEPDLATSWSGSAFQFATLIYSPAVSIIRNLNPTDTIVAPGWAQNNEFGFFPSQETPYPLFGWNGARDNYVPGMGDLEEYFQLIGGINAFNVWGVHSYAHFSMLDENWSHIIQSYSCNWDIWIQTLSDNAISPFPLWITEIGINSDEQDPDGYTEQQASDFLEYFLRDQILHYYPANDGGEFDGPDPFIAKVILYELYDESAFYPDTSYFGFFRKPGDPKPAADMLRSLITDYYTAQK